MRFPSCLCLLALAAPAFSAEPDAAGVEFFEKKIRPVLAEHCYSCHSAEAVKNKKLKGGLFLDTKAGVLKGGETGPALVSGKPEQSLLMKGLRYSDELRMPPKGKLPDAVVADFAKWIAMGAPDPRDGTAIVAKAIDIEAGRKFWAFQPPRKPAPPEVRNQKTEITNEIDRFIVASLESKGLKPLDEAEPRVLVRRLYFDLIGLPPTPEQVEEFVRDQKPDALELLVDKLLKSPHHGERWGRHWLDVARFAEDQAHTFGVKPFTFAWRYRDWVVKALNDDMPYDRFIQLQLAGDLLPDTPADPFERYAGLGFLGLGVEYYKNTAAQQAAADELDDRIDTLTRGFLGLTAACARCHDHKFDPIPTADYYALAGIYNGSSLQAQPLAAPATIKAFRDAEQKVKSTEGQMKKWTDETAKKYKIKAISKEQETKLLSEDEKKALATLRTELETAKKALPPRPPETHVLAGGGKTMKVYVRGNPATPGETAPKGFLQVLSKKDAPRGEAYGRLELARAIASKDNPLTARVIVNRVWQQHFGRGLVGTPSNFGYLGDKPTHPELLDWLAVRFMENGWSLKKLHRDIVLSSAYRRASADEKKNAESDADNKLLWRYPRRRLDIEAWRDGVLAVSGKLDRALGGPPLDLSNAGNARRTVYARISRHRLDATLALWDFPDPNVTSATRVVTTIPQQQLFVLNGEWMVGQAKAFAARLQPMAKDDAGRVKAAFGSAFQRAPSEAELALALEYLSLPAEKDDKLTRWESYAQALLGTNEMLFVD